MDTFGGAPGLGPAGWQKTAGRRGVAQESSAAESGSPCRSVPVFFGSITNASCTRKAQYSLKTVNLDELLYSYLVLSLNRGLTTSLLDP